MKHMILGCLLDSPAHGYEIRKRFKIFYNQSHGLNEGQLYTTVKKMETEGLVTKELVHQEKNPSRKVLSITEKGRQEFYRWLYEEESDPVVFDFFHTFQFLQKCNYFMYIPQEMSVDLIGRQIEKEVEKRDEFFKIRSAMSELGVHHYRLLIIEYGISCQDTKIKWLRHLMDEVSKKT
ncbi:MAG: PadR family transcriptional regulator [Bacillota bacterium]